MHPGSEAYKAGSSAAPCVRPMYTQPSNALRPSQRPGSHTLMKSCDPCMPTWYPCLMLC